MKIIFDTTLQSDNVTSIVASSEDSEFPVANLQNTFTTDVWRAAAGVLTATLTIDVSKGSALELLNTNAKTASATVGGTPVPVTVYQLPGEKGRLWIDYTEDLAPHTIVLTLTADVDVYAGILRAGIVKTFDDPINENKEESQDFSIELELNNGSDYFRTRNIVRIFNEITIYETRANAFILKHDIFDVVGPEPLAIRLVHKYITDAEFILFAKRTSPIKLNHIWKNLTAISMELREVI
jgi:hypothetical protein